MIYGTHFTFAGQDSRDYGVMLVSFGTDNEDEVSTGLGIEAITDNLIDRTIDYGGKYTEVLKPKMEIAKMSTKTNDYFTHRQTREILRWLTCTKDLEWLTIYDGDDVVYNYLCRFSLINQKRINGNTAGFVLGVTCDSPFAYSDIKEVELNISEFNYTDILSVPEYNVADLCLEEDLIPDTETNVDWDSAYNTYKDYFLFQDVYDGSDTFYKLECLSSIPLFPTSYWNNCSNVDKINSLYFIFNDVHHITFYESDRPLFTAYNGSHIDIESKFLNGNLNSVKFALFYDKENSNINSFSNKTDFSNMLYDLKQLRIWVETKEIMDDNYISYVSQEDGEHVYPLITIENNNGTSEKKVTLQNKSSDYNYYITCVIPAMSKVVIDTLNQVVCEKNDTLYKYIEYTSSDRFFRIQNGVNNICLQSSDSVNVTCKLEYREKYKVGVF